MPLVIRVFLFRFFLWLTALGCAVSGAASGRFSIRLVVDGALAFVFVPVIAIASCAVVLMRRSPSRPRLLDAIGAFLDGNGPWLMWLTAVAASASSIPPRALGPWLPPIAISMVIPIAWSLAIDFRFFREGVGRTTREACRDLAIQRSLSWSAIVAYFFGIAIVGEVVPQVIGWARW